MASRLAQLFPFYPSVVLGLRCVVQLRSLWCVRLSLAPMSAHCPDACVVITAMAFTRHGATLLAEFRVMLRPIDFLDGRSTFLANRCIELSPVLRLDHFPAMFRLWCRWLRSALLAYHRCPSLLLVVIVAYQEEASGMALNRVRMPENGLERAGTHRTTLRPTRAKAARYRHHVGDQAGRVLHSLPVMPT